MANWWDGLEVPEDPNSLLPGQPQRQPTPGIASPSGAFKLPPAPNLAALQARFQASIAPLPAPQPVAPAPKPQEPASTWQTLKDIGGGIVETVRGVPAVVGSMAESVTNPNTEQDWKDRLIESGKQRQQSNLQELRSSGEYDRPMGLGMPFTRGEWAETTQSFPYTAATMLPALAGGAVGSAIGGAIGGLGGPAAPATVPAGIAAGRAIGGTLGGMLGAYLPAGGAAANQYIRDALDRYRTEAISKTGKEPSPEELDAYYKTTIEPQAWRVYHGEAAPEAAGTVAELGLMKSAIGDILHGGGSLPVRIAKAGAKTALSAFGVEPATETLTQNIQQPAFSAAGLTDEPPRDWSLESLGKSAGEVYKQAAATSLFFSALGLPIGAVHGVYQNRREGNARADRAEQATADLRANLDLANENDIAQALAGFDQLEAQGKLPKAAAARVEQARQQLTRELSLRASPEVLAEPLETPRGQEGYLGLAERTDSLSDEQLLQAAQRPLPQDVGDELRAAHKRYGDALAQRQELAKVSAGFEADPDAAKIMTGTLQALTRGKPIVKDGYGSPDFNLASLSDDVLERYRRAAEVLARSEKAKEPAMAALATLNQEAERRAAGERRDPEAIRVKEISVKLASLPDKKLNTALKGLSAEALDRMADHLEQFARTNPILANRAQMIRQRANKAFSQAQPAPAPAKPIQPEPEPAPQAPAAPVTPNAPSVLEMGRRQLAEALARQQAARAAAQPEPATEPAPGLPTPPAINPALPTPAPVQPESLSNPVAPPAPGISQGPITPALPAPRRQKPTNAKPAIEAPQAQAEPPVELPTGPEGARGARAEGTGSEPGAAASEGRAEVTPDQPVKIEPAAKNISFDVIVNKKVTRVHDARIVDLKLPEIVGDELFAVHPAFEKEGGFVVSHVATGARIGSPSTTPEGAIEYAKTLLQRAGKQRFEEGVHRVAKKSKKLGLRNEIPGASSAPTPAPEPNEKVTRGKRAWEMTRDEWLAATRFYRSGKDKMAETPTGERIILKREATEKTFRETSADFLNKVRGGQIRDALAKGKPVPAEVLSEYPDLASAVRGGPTGRVVSPPTTAAPAPSETANAQERQAEAEAALLNGSSPNERIQRPSVNSEVNAGAFNGVSVGQQRNSGVNIPTDISTRVSPQNNPSLVQSVSNGRLTATKLFGNIRNRDTILKKGYGGINRNLQRVVLSNVLSSIQDPKIFNSVIRLVPVDVMNQLAGKKFPSEMLLHNPSVLSDALSFANLNSPIILGRFIDDLATASANLPTGRTAKETSGTGNTAGGSVNNNPTGTTINDRQGISPNRNAEQGGPSVTALGSPSIIQNKEKPSSKPLLNQEQPPSQEGGLVAPEESVDSKAVVTWPAKTAMELRISREISEIERSGNKAEAARKRGFYDQMLNLPSRRDQYNDRLQVAYDQGVKKAKSEREIINERFNGIWYSDKIEKEGTVWEWVVYREGILINNGESKSQKEAFFDVLDAKLKDKEKILKEQPPASTGAESIAPAESPKKPESPAPKGKPAPSKKPPIKVAQRWNDANFAGRIAILREIGSSEDFSKRKASEWPTWDQIPEGPIKKRLRDAHENWLEQQQEKAPPSPAPVSGKSFSGYNGISKRVLIVSGEHSGKTGTLTGQIQKEFKKEQPVFKIQLDGYPIRGGWNGQIHATSDQINEISDASEKPAPEKAPSLKPAVEVEKQPTGVRQNEPEAIGSGEDRQGVSRSGVQPGSRPAQGVGYGSPVQRPIFGSPRPIADLIAEGLAQPVELVNGLLDSYEEPNEDNDTINRLEVNIETAQAHLDAIDAALGDALPGMEARPRLEDDLSIIPVDREEDQDDLPNGSWIATLGRNPSLSVRIDPIEVDEESDPIAPPPGAPLVYGGTVDKNGRASEVSLYSIDNGKTLFGFIDAIEQANAVLKTRIALLAEKTSDQNATVESTLNSYFDRPDVKPIYVIKTKDGQFITWSQSRRDMERKIASSEDPIYAGATVERMTEKTWAARKVPVATPQEVSKSSSAEVEEWAKNAQEIVKGQQAAYDLAVLNIAENEAFQKAADAELRKARRGSKAYSQLQTEISTRSKKIEADTRTITRFELAALALDESLPEWKRVVAAMRLSGASSTGNEIYWKLVSGLQDYPNDLREKFAKLAKEANGGKAFPLKTLERVERRFTTPSSIPSYDFGRTTLRDWPNNEFEQTVRSEIRADIFAPIAEERAIKPLNAMRTDALDQDINRLINEANSARIRANYDETTVPEFEAEMDALVEKGRDILKKREEEAKRKQEEAAKAAEALRAEYAEIIARWESPLPAKTKDADGNKVTIPYVDGLGPVRLVPIPKNIKESDNPIVAISDSAAKEDVRYYLNYVYADAENVVATDGHQMVVIPNAGNIKEGYYNPKSGTPKEGMEGTKFPDYKRLVNHDKNDIAIEKNVSLDDLIARINAAVQARKFIADKGDRERAGTFVAQFNNGKDDFYLDSRLLLKALSSLKAATGANTVTVKIHKKDGEALHFSADKTGATALVMPFKEPGEKITYVPIDLEEMEKPDVRQSVPAAPAGTAKSGEGQANDRQESKVEAVVDQPSEGKESEAEPAKPGKLTNFGEKLAGKRIRSAPSLDQDLSDKDIASQPLSKIWPAEEIDGIEDSFVAAVAFAARAEVPAKPHIGFKLNRWVEQVKLVRGLAQTMTRGQLTRDEFLKKLTEKFDLDNFKSKVLLLESLDRKYWKRIGGVGIYPDSYRYNEKGEQIPAPYSRVTIDGVSHPFLNTKSVADLIEPVTALLSNAPSDKKMKFEIRVRRSTGESFINKVGDPEYRPLKTFQDVKEARAFIKNHHEDLVAAWEAIKERDNVKEVDVRNTENRPRVGADHRHGKDATSTMFMDTFGFRGVEFGEWVSQGKNIKERQGMLNAAYDSLMDLATLLKIPSKAISLNGSLGIAFGSRGYGWASAHFEPTNIVINLTKTRGAGTLAHEWFHALDNYFSRMREGLGAEQGNREERYITYRPEPMYVHKTKSSGRMTRAMLEKLHKENPNSAYLNPDEWKIDPNHPQGVRPEVERSFAQLVEALNQSPMASRSRSIDKNSDGYWSRIIERAARSFENFIIDRMMQGGYHNDYLANVREVSSFPRAKDRYPYLLPEELAPIKSAFENLFDTVQTRATEKGVQLFARASTPATQVAQEAIDLFGLTDRLSEAGFVLPDGSLLDFSGHSQSSDYQRKGNRWVFVGKGKDSRSNQRSVDHREVSKLPSIAQSMTDGMLEFQSKAQAIRIDVASGRVSANFSNWTPAQMRAVMAVARENNGELTLDLNHPVTGRLLRSIELNNTTQAKIAKILQEETTKDPRFSRQQSIVSPTTPATLRASLEALAGNEQVQGLIDNGSLRLVARQDQLPASIKVPLGQRVAGAVEPKTGTVYLIAENIQPDEVAGFLTHEVGVHQEQLGLNAPKSNALRLAHAILRLTPARQWMGEASFNNALEQLERMRAAGNPRVVAAFEQARAAMGALGQNKALLREESLAYLVQNEANRTLPLVRRILAALRAFLYRAGFRVNLTENDLFALANSALRTAARRANATTMTASPAFSRNEEDAEAARQYADVVAKYTNPDGSKKAGWMKAPNGKPTNLNERQWVQVRTPAFLNWFGDWINDPKNASKVVDENGEPKVVYHGTRSDIEKFDKRKSRINKAFFFSQNHKFASSPAYTGYIEQSSKGGGNILPVYLRIKNHKEISDLGMNPMAESGAIELAKIEKHDGIRVLNDNYWIAFSPTQIKSAIGNTGAFSPVNSDIRYAATLGVAEPTLTADELLDRVQSGELAELTPEQWAQVQQAFMGNAVRATPPTGVNAPSFQEWFGKSKIKAKDGKPLVMYHGTTADFTQFKAGKAGDATTHPTAALGFFFTNNKAHAAGKYGGNVLEVYLAIDRPYLMTDADLRAIDTLEDAKKLRAKLEAQGYDGIVMPAETSTRYVAAFHPDQIKFTNNRSYTRIEPDMRFAYAGEKARTADQSLLQQAKTRVDAGEDAEAVRQETGWFKGKDDKWRFEIDDSNFEIEHYSFAFENLREFKDSAHPLNLVVRQPKNISGRGYGYVDIFQAYPQLKNLPVISTRDNSHYLTYQKDSSGMEKSRIIIGGRFWNKYKSLSNEEIAAKLAPLMLHEIQHAVQQIEGFSEGGNSNIFRNEAYESQLKKLNNDLDFYEKNGRFPGLPAENNESYLEFIKKTQEELKNYNPHKQYLSLHGEIEARDTANRQDMTADQRRATPPYRATMFKDGIKDEDVIVRMENDGTMASEQRFAIASKKSTHPLIADAEKYGITVEQNPDGTIILHHGTKKELANKIEKQGKIERGTYFSHSLDVTGYEDEPPSYYATVKNKGGKVLSEKIDPDSVEFVSGTGEFYAPDGLVKGKDGVWRSPTNTAASSKSSASRVKAPTVQDVYKDQIQVKGQWYHAERVFGKSAQSYQVGDPVPELAATNGQRFAIASPSRLASKVLGDIGEVRDTLKPGEKTLAKADPRNFRQMLSDLKANKRPQWLALLTQDHLLELAKTQLPADAVKQFDDASEKLDAYENRMIQSEGFPLADRWQTLARKSKAQADALGRALHMSTWLGVDPRKPAPKGKQVEWVRTKAALDALTNPEARKLYDDVLKFYADQTQRLFDELAARIMRHSLPEADKLAARDLIRQEFERIKQEGPYAPLMRFGDLTVWAEPRKTGEKPVFATFETVQDQRAFVDWLKSEGYQPKLGVKMEEIAKRALPQGDLVGKLAGIVDQSVKGPQADVLKDAIYQLFLRSLPEQAIRKHFIHRKYVPGYSADALRTFATFARRSSKQIARLAHGDRMGSSIDAMAKAVRDGTVDNPVAAGHLVNELDQSYQWTMNPQTADWASRLTHLGFLWHLGASPAHLLLNLSQQAQVTAPWLAGELHGKKSFAAVLAALARANLDFLRTNPFTDPAKRGAHAKKMRAQIEGEYNGDLGRALKDLEAAGKTDKSQTYSISGMSSEDQFLWSKPWLRKITQGAAWFFHTAEVINREASAIAAYRLGRQAGMDHEAAYDLARRAINESHWDYSPSNRARFMRPNPAKVITLFKQYSLNISWQLGRNAYLAARGASPEVKAVARTKLLGMLGVTALMAGAAGMPFYNELAWMLTQLMNAFGDDDEPEWDFDTRFRRMLDDALNPTASEAIRRGAVNAFFGIDLSSRVKLDDLWWRSLDDDLHGKQYAYAALEQALGPVAGLAVRSVSTVDGLWDALVEGTSARGASTRTLAEAMPKALKDISRSFRFATEGATTASGAPLLSREELGTGAIVGQAIGFRPSQLTERQAANTAMLNLQDKIQRRRNAILDTINMALWQGDTEVIAALQEDIAAFNKRYPTLAITGETLQKSIEAGARRRLELQLFGGAPLNKKLAGMLLEGR